MALFYFITMAAVLASAYCNEIPKPEVISLPKPTEYYRNFVRSDTFAVCTMNYFKPSNTGYGRQYNSNSGYNSESSNTGQVGNAYVGENVYGDGGEGIEQGNENNDFIQCSQHAWQVYNENNNNNNDNEGNNNNYGYNNAYNNNDYSTGYNNDGYNNNAYNTGYNNDGYNNNGYNSYD